MVAKETSSPSVSVGHFRNQYYAVIAANLIVFSHGCFVSWPTPILPLLKSNDTPLTTGPLSLEEVSWVVSIGALGSMIAALIARAITNRIGCKLMMTTYLSILSLICWSLIAFGRTKYHILISRFLCGGIGAGNDSAVLLFVAEIADNRIRGALGSFAPFVRSTGYMTAVIVGTYVDYAVVPYIFIGIPVVFFAIFLWLPNTAPHLIRIGKHEEAKKSIRFYKGYTGESAETTNALNVEYERLIAIAAQNAKRTESITVKKLQQPIVYKGLLIGIILTFLNQYCGCFTLISYSVVIFQESNKGIDPYISAMVLGALQAAGTLSSTSLVETLGRKLLLIISMVGCTLGLTVMATYMYLVSLGFDLAILDWIPVVSLGFVVFISSVGIVALTYLCIVESLPTEARTFGLAVSIITLNGFAFVSSKMFPILMETIHLHGCMLMYAIACAFGTFFVAVAIKETKGKSLDEIHEDK